MRKVVVFVSERDAADISAAIARTGGSRLGNYSESVSHAASFEHGSLRALDEKRIEFACDDDTYAAVLAAIGAVTLGYPTTVDSWSLETIDA